MILRISNYFFDFLYGATKYPCGLFSTKVYLGMFPKTPTGKFQEFFYRELIRSGFKRTFWQLVFPGQIAGVVKKVQPNINGANELHVRFYFDGTIDCEIEVSRFSELHWSGYRKHDPDFLRTMLAEFSLPEGDRRNIEALFGEKSFSSACTRQS